MEEKIIHKYHGKFLLIFIFLLTISCSVSEIKIIQSHEEKSITYGISKQDFSTSKFFNTLNGKKTYKSSLTSENLLKRLNLDSAYFYSDSKIEVLHIPVKTLGKYKRTLLSISKQKTSNTFIITYPNPDDSRLFYITDLQGKLIQKVTVDEKGIGHNEFYNNKSTTAKTSGMCTETVYVVCSSGEHSFALDNAFACTYWQNLSAGTPPQLFTVNTQCEDYGTGGGTGGGTVDNSPPSGGGGTSIAPVSGGGTPTDLTSLDCIQYLDCENCNLPGDLNNNCSLDYNEAMFNSYLSQNDFSSESWNFVNQMVNQMAQSPNLIFDVNSSLKSPFNIDKSAITGTTPEDQKFNLAYYALTESPEFKKIFIDLFQDDKRFNVKFEIEDHVFEDNDSSKKEVHATTSQLPGTNNIVIKISKQILVADGTMSQTNIENAKTILHECIHAYLFVKANYSAAGTDFVKILNTMYPTPNEQHDFMFSHMIPTMQKVLGEIRDKVTTEPKRAAIEQYTMHPTLNPMTSTPFNWPDFYKYISLSGLDETSCFKQDFPYNSDALSLLDQYIKGGKRELDR